MKIIAQCPFCGYNWKLEDSAADRRIRCKNCDRLFKVPDMEDVPKAVKTIKDSRGKVYVDESGRTYG